MPERLNGLVSKTSVPSGTAGSNPALSVEIKKRKRLMNTLIGTREAMGGILQGGPPHQTMNFVALLQQQLGQVGAVLPCNAR